MNTEIVEKARAYTPCMFVYRKVEICFRVEEEEVIAIVTIQMPSSRQLDIIVVIIQVIVVQIQHAMILSNSFHKLHSLKPGISAYHIFPKKKPTEIFSATAYARPISKRYRVV